jgi:lipoprotein-anchoring transpeptidase ErfK/SrfK
MVRNDSVVRIVMLLCFSTALLMLAVRSHVSSSSSSMMPTQPQKNTDILTPSTARAKNLQQPTSNQASIPEKLTRFLQSSRISVTDDTARAMSPQDSSLKDKVTKISTERRLVIDLSDRRVYVYQTSRVIASFPLGVGKKGWETPLGNFEVIHMQHNPVWKHPITGKIFEAGADSPLGDRWVGFWSDGHNEIGFHGTPDDSLVGTAASHGCLRMRNPDVRMLYEKVKVGTPVEVRN